jgi:Fe-S cluster biogenesis protein NfuA
MDLADRVAIALRTSVLPTVIARGGQIRVLTVENGVAVLEVSGSPGATAPLIARIEKLIRKSVPEVTSIRMTGPGGQPLHQDTEGSLAERVRHILDVEINPIIAAHGGRATLVEIKQGWIRLQLEGGCQGCSLAEVTVRQGIEPLLRARVPDVVGVVDMTDHQAGRKPFYTAAKR